MKDHTNPDPISGEKGAHPVGTAVGAVGTGVLSTVVGGVLGGPLGAVAGAAAGAAIGGIVGHEAAEYVNPTYEQVETRLQEQFASRPYSPGRQFDDYKEAYAFGAGERALQTGRPWDADLEEEMKTKWESSRANVRMSFPDAREAVRDAWQEAGRPSRQTG